MVNKDNVLHRHPGNKIRKIKRILNNFILIFLTNIKFMGSNILYISGFNLFLSFPIIYSKGKKRQVKIIQSIPFQLLPIINASTVTTVIKCN